MLAIAGHIVRRDVQLALSRIHDTVGVVLFFVIAIALFPLGVGPELSILARISGGTLWVAALLAAMLSFDRLFQDDVNDGSFDLLALTPAPLELVVLAKTLAHWLTTGVPLIIAAPVLALLMNLPTDGFFVLILSLTLGTPILSLIGAIGAALTVGARRAGVLLSILVIPLVIPVLIFGVSAIEAAVTGQPARPHLMILGGLLLGSMVLSPWAAAAGLRLALE